MAVFDDDTALVRDGDVWRGEVSPRWHVGAGANGGYLASLSLRAALELAPLPDPLSMTTHYLQRPRYEPIELRPRLRHATKGHAFLAVDATQDDRALFTSLVVVGVLRHTGPSPLQGRMPETAPPDEHATIPHNDDPALEFTRRFEYRAPRPEFEAFYPDAPGVDAAQGWMRLLDRDLDPLAVPLFMDGMPPAPFGTLGPGLMPTIELTVHWRSRPRTHWHFGHFATRFFMGGYVEEDGELWGEDGTLVAMSRQLARYVPAGTPS